MKSYLDKIFILEGILLAIIGVLFFINPVNAFFNFTTICGILIIIAGILRIIRAFGTDSKMYYILTGIIDILFGFIIWFNPISTTETLIIVFGIWILLKVIYSIILAFKYKTFGFNAVTILSIISIILGGIVFIAPLSVVFVLPYIPYILGVCFIVLAVTEIYLGYKL